MSKTSRTSAAAVSAAADTGPAVTEANTQGLTPEQQAEANLAASNAERAEAGLDPLPDFQPGTLYDVQLLRNVEFPPGTGNFLRPGELHHLDGAYAAGMKDAISGAAAVTP
jgi:hypothetical protein